MLARLVGADRRCSEGVMTPAAALLLLNMTSRSSLPATLLLPLLLPPGRGRAVSPQSNTALGYSVIRLRLRLTLLPPATPSSSSLQPDPFQPQ